ncbi:MAG: hypothetical protein ACFCBU_12280 [Cyanophyceae cyanobacterium]
MTGFWAGGNLYSGLISNLCGALKSSFGSVSSGILGRSIPSNMGVMVRYQDSSALIVVLVVGYLGLIYFLLLFAQQQWGRSRSLLPKQLLKRWQRFQNPNARLMEIEDDLGSR